MLHYATIWLCRISQVAYSQSTPPIFGRRGTGASRVFCHVFDRQLACGEFFVALARRRRCDVVHQLSLTRAGTAVETQGKRSLILRSVRIAMAVRAKDARSRLLKHPPHLCKCAPRIELCGRTTFGNSCGTHFGARRDGRARHFNLAAGGAQHSLPNRSNRADCWPLAKSISIWQTVELS